MKHVQIFLAKAGPLAVVGFGLFACAAPAPYPGPYYDSAGYYYPQRAYYPPPAYYYPAYYPATFFFSGSFFFHDRGRRRLTTTTFATMALIIAAAGTDGTTENLPPTLNITAAHRSRSGGDMSTKRCFVSQHVELSLGPKADVVKEASLDVRRCDRHEIAVVRRAWKGQCFISADFLKSSVTI